MEGEMKRGFLEESVRGYYPTEAHKQPSFVAISVSENDSIGISHLMGAPGSPFVRGMAKEIFDLNSPNFFTKVVENVTFRYRLYLWSTAVGKLVEELEPLHPHGNPFLLQSV
jgi:hypothetical protein